MKTLTSQELSALGRLTDQNLVRRWQGLARKSSSGSVVTIANTGLVNSGKSSLFNALLDSYDDPKRFKEGAVRTTIQGDREHLNSSIDLLDTPGIDATDEDDEAAFSAVMAADLIVIVHNIKTGMLNAAEYNWIRRIAMGMSHKSILERVVLVCSWIDEREREEGYRQAVDETIRQAYEALGAQVPFWEVSAKRYLNAHGAKPGLAKASKIPQFREFLLQQAERARAGLNAARKQEALALAQETIALLQERKKQYSFAVSKKERKAKENSHSKLSTWTAVLQGFLEKRQGVFDKLKKLESEEVDPFTAIWFPGLRFDYSAFREEIDDY